MSGAPWLAYQLQPDAAPQSSTPPSQPAADAPQGPWSAYQYYQKSGGAIPVGQPAMPSDWDQAKSLIEQKESGGRNVPNYRFDATHTAQGYFQITDTNWNAYAPKVGIDLKQYPDAMSAPEDVQEKVAKKLYDERGLQPWSESLGPKTKGGNWNVSPSAIASEQSTGADVRYMSPDDYLALTPEQPEEAASSAKRKSLDKSLAAGDDIEAIPTLDVKAKGDRLIVYDQDGRNRAEAAKTAGVDLIPVAIKGVPASAPLQIQGMRGGEARPFDFAKVGKVELPASPIEKIEHAGIKAVEDTERAFGSVAAGAAEVPVGIAQLAAHGAEAVGVLGADSAAKATDTAANALQSYIQGGDLSQRGAGVIGNMAATAFLPTEMAPGGAGALRALADALKAGGIAGAAQPVTGPQLGDYWRAKAAQAGEGAATGGAVQGGAGLVQGGASALGRIVTPGDLTRAAVRLFGEDARRVTPELLNRAAKRIGSIMETIEKGHDIDLSDQQLFDDLANAEAGAVGTLGQAEAGPVVRQIDHIMQRATSEGVIPGKSAATTWHKGSQLDKLTESSNPDVARHAQQVQTAMRNALQRQLPPAEAATYSAARSQWRDMKIVSGAMKPQLGIGQVSPRRYVAQVAKRFEPGVTGGPPVLELGRAAAQTWTPSAGSVLSRLGRDAAGMTVGGILGTLLGGPIGGAGGSLAAGLAMDRLSLLRLAKPGPAAILRPGSVPQAAPINTAPFAAPASAAALQAFSALR